jgi:hypothetical protein
MNKPLLLFFSLLVVAAGALAYHFLSARGADPRVPAAAAAYQPPPSLLGKGNSKPPASASSEHRRTESPPRPAGTTYTESPAMLEARQKMADSINRQTPEMRLRLVDAMMRMREPGYRQLFDSWKLDPAAAADALRILRDRETSHSDLRTKFWGDPSSDIREYSDAVKAETTATETRLLQLLGQDRLMELIQQEERMKAESMAKAREMTERYKN